METRPTFLQQRLDVAVENCTPGVFPSHAAAQAVNRAALDQREDALGYLCRIPCGVYERHVLATDFARRRHLGADDGHADQPRLQHGHAEALAVAGHKHHIAHAEQIGDHGHIDEVGLVGAGAGFEDEAHFPLDAQLAAQRL